MTETTDLFDLPCECGCAAKIPAARLSDMLRGLRLPSSDCLIVGPDTLDDAGVYRMPDGTCLIQTVDFFPPVARTPRDYGRIAAANALSDVYAMGGTPITAMAIVCFPMATLAQDVLDEIMRGAADKLLEADTLLVGGHSVVDPIPKFGLAVTGTVRASDLLTNAAARPGDVLILTKPLGTGTTIQAAKANIASREQEDAANLCMATLNAEASRLALAHNATACTDITGFGLLGHAVQMARASGVGLEIDLSTVPLLEEATRFAETGLLSAATYANRKHSGQSVHFADNISQAEQDTLLDPQTSGGLLIALPRGHAGAFMSEADRTLTTTHAIVGRVTGPGTGQAVTVLRKGAI